MLPFEQLPNSRVDVSRVRRPTRLGRVHVRVDSVLESNDDSSQFLISGSGLAVSLLLVSHFVLDHRLDSFARFHDRFECLRVGRQEGRIASALSRTERSEPVRRNSHVAQEKNAFLLSFRTGEQILEDSRLVLPQECNQGRMHVTRSQVLLLLLAGLSRLHEQP